MDWLIVGIAGFIGGALNAVAGGGSFITLPALIYVGVPPIAANATGTAALLPGYIASAWRFRKDIEFPAKLAFPTIVIIAIAGGSLGASILLLTSEQLFSTLIPWLILLASAAFVLGPRFLNARKTVGAESKGQHVAHELGRAAASLVLLAVCIYGGYFNGGLGIILLAALGLMGQTNLHGMNGLKNLVSALLTTVAIVVYAAGGTVAGKYLPLLGVTAIVGGYSGAAFAYRIPLHILRGGIACVGILMAAIFFLK
jgi:uncharacterized membrane protein YfcA